MSVEKKRKVPVVEKKSFSLSNFKEKIGIVDSIKDKDLEWIPMSVAYQEATGLPGFPKGNVSLSRGYPSTGKSTSMIELAVGCQKVGIIPIIIDVENAFNFQHAREIGFQFDEIADENGEVVNYDGFFIYINNDYLIKNYGIKKDKNRDEASIENIAEFCHEILDKQLKEELPYEVCFLLDSCGALDCEQGIVSKTKNNMWSAAAYEAAFKSLLHHRIPASRKIDKKYTNTFFAVQKIWIESVNNKKVVKHKGGEAFYYFSRLILHWGGTLTHGVTKLIATSNGKDFVWGNETKLSVVKNHINGVSYNGTVVSTSHGFIKPSETDKYKKENKKYILSKLGIEDGELEFKKEEDTSGLDEESPEDFINKI